MIDTTTLEDLAKKIEWVGLCNLSVAEKLRVEGELEPLTRHLPRLLALAIWSYYGRRMPDEQQTCSMAASVERRREREGARQRITDLMTDYRLEENPLE